MEAASYRAIKTVRNLKGSTKRNDARRRLTLVYLINSGFDALVDSCFLAVRSSHFFAISSSYVVRVRNIEVHQFCLFAIVVAGFVFVRVLQETHWNTLPTIFETESGPEKASALHSNS